jgi:hypothetical protein
VRTRPLLGSLLIVAVLAGGVTAALHYHRLRTELRSLYRGTFAAVPAAAEPASAAVVDIKLDLAAPGQPISPLIYGIATKNPDAVAGLGATSDRWGGNPSSRYNWVVGNACNAADDWEFRNQTCGVQGKDSASDNFVARDNALSMASLITVPALGWVASSTDNSQRSVNVPNSGGPAIDASGAIAGYDPTSNRARTSVKSLADKPGAFVFQPDPASSVVYQDEWVNHLVTRFGTAAQGGVRYYEIDNEPMLWSSTQRDVHPAQMSYDSLASVFAQYSDAIKGVDPTAQVLGPESWGWTEYQYSALDQGPDDYATHADRLSHGDLALLPWFLKTTHARDQQRGTRSLDMLTVHFYPQAHGVYGDTSNPTTDALRLRSTRALWDPTYVDESWIKEPVALIPSLRKWVSQYYPNTPVGITEYNFGGGASPSAALAEAEALGIFGREGASLANYWPSPKPGSPTWFAFRMFRNYDGNGGAFGSTSVPSSSTSGDLVSSYAARSAAGVTLMLINKQLTTDQEVTVSLGGQSRAGAVARYQYSGQKLDGIVREEDLPLASGGSLTLHLPAGSITLLQVPVG